MSRKTPRGRKWQLALLAGLFCVAGIQVIRPRLENPPITGDLQAPLEVKQVLKRACYNCHSNETKLAWFDEMAPGYWLVAADVRKARKVLNFSEWDSLPKEQQKAKLFEALNKITFKEMPLKRYRYLHSDAAVTPEEEKVIRNYLSELVTPVKFPDTARRNAAREQYEKWMQTPVTPGSGTPSPNGIEFMPDYKNWVAISTTERFDNGTMRVITGNDIAVKATKEGHINPWPDGATFAKIAWDQSIDSTGSTHTGAFKQVEFMIKDKSKYTATDGWGFARWVKGTQLVPYGKNALFVTECTNCHKPMQDRDFVFTSPLNLAEKHAGQNINTAELYNQEASLPEAAPLDPLEWKVICSAITRKDQRMSTLYGNDIALKTARTAPGQGYPAGAVLSLVTWSQKEDKDWYGATIPAAIQSIEKIVFSAAPDGSSLPLYEYYGGKPLKKDEASDPGTIQKRVSYIVEQQASVMP